MESRYDFYRIVLPGAIMVGLLDLAIRLTAMASEGDIKEQSRRALDFVEDPIRGLVLAFAFGICLYFTEPGYNAPQFFYRIPSSHFHSLLSKRVPSDPDLVKKALSLYFRALDELVPDSLQERALLYGAFYRIGFQTIFFTLAVASSLPLAIVALGGVDPPAEWSSPGLGTWLVVAIPVVVGSAGLVAARLPARHPQARRLGWRFTLGLGLLATGTTLGWISYTSPDTAEGLVNPEAVVSALTGLQLGIWALLRLRGPIKPFVRSLWVPQSHRPDRPHSDAQIAFLDLSAFAPAAAGLLVLRPSIEFLQVVGVCLLGAIALLLSSAKKHERRLAGIYSNQNAWLDANVERVVALAAPSKPGRSDHVSVAPDHSEDLPEHRTVSQTGSAQRRPVVIRRLVARLCRNIGSGTETSVG